MKALYAAAFAAVIGFGAACQAEDKKETRAAGFVT